MRRFEFVGGTSAKFWTCKVEDSTFTIVFGRLGTDGQRKEKEFDDEEEANAEMAKKITEKLKEGYVEVAADAAAPAGAKGAEAAAVKLALPQRFHAASASLAPALIKAATASLKALARSTSSRSWRRQLAAKEARRALHRLRGVDLSAHKELGEAFDAVADAVIAKPALPLTFVLSLIDELPASAVDRLLARWTKPAGPCGKALVALKSVHDSLGGIPDKGGDIDELVLRVGRALADHHASDIAAVARFNRVRSFVEAASAPKGGLKKWLAAVDDGGDVVVARRKALFAA